MENPHAPPQARAGPMRPLELGQRVQRSAQIDSNQRHTCYLATIQGMDNSPANTLRDRIKARLEACKLENDGQTTGRDIKDSQDSQDDSQDDIQDAKRAAPGPRKRGRPRKSDQKQSGDKPGGAVEGPSRQNEPSQPPAWVASRTRRQPTDTEIAQRAAKIAVVQALTGLGRTEKQISAATGMSLGAIRAVKAELKAKVPGVSVNGSHDPGPAIRTEDREEGPGEGTGDNTAGGPLAVTNYGELRSKILAAGLISAEMGKEQVLAWIKERLSRRRAWISLAEEDGDMRAIGKFDDTEGKDLDRVVKLLGIGEQAGKEVEVRTIVFNMGGPGRPGGPGGPGSPGGPSVTGARVPGGQSDTAAGPILEAEYETVQLAPVQPAQQPALPAPTRPAIAQVVRATTKE